MSIRSRTRLLVALAAAAGVLPRQAAGQAPDGAPVVTLAEARRRAAVVDPDAVEARGRTDAATWERRAALANFLTPTVTAGGSYSHYSDPFFNFGTGGFSPNHTSATLQAEYVLLGAGKLGMLRSSRASVASAEAAETEARFATALGADSAWFSVHADRELARVAAERLGRAEEQLGVARARVTAGEAIASDSLQLLLEANRARLAVLSADSALAVSRLRLGRAIGLEGPADVAALDTAAPPALPITEAEAIAELRARGPAVIAARAAERRADALLVVERERYLPAIVFDAGTYAYDSRLFPSALRTSLVGVTVSIPLWNAGQRELDVARARVERDAARARRADRERASAETMVRAYHGYVTARAGIELARTGVAAAAENYRVQRARYAEGATTILDLLGAQVALGEAESGLVRSRYGAQLALAQIEALLGRRLVEADAPRATPQHD